MIQSPLFWATLTVTVVVYWTVPLRWRHGLVAAISFGYLGWIAPLGAGLAAGWSLVAWWLLRPRPGQPPRRGPVALVVGGVVASLFGFKYLPSLAAASSAGSSWGRLAIPLGISYFSFKLVHWAVEVARGTITDRSAARFLSWMLLFPAFPAGPIERHDHFLAGLEQRWRAMTAAEGVIRIAHALVKKILLVDGLLLLLLGPHTPAELAAGAAAVSPWTVWRVVIINYLRVYLDFSAYSDLAIGAARLVGVRLVENFDFPILAADIGEFWRRWHISLVAWCTSYVYLPLLGAVRNPYLATISVFMVIGVWHGGSLHWLLWGCYHASGVVAFRWWRRRRRPSSRTWWRRALGLGLTQLFVAAGGAFTMGYGATGAYDGVRLFLKLLWIDLPG